MQILQLWIQIVDPRCLRAIDSLKQVENTAFIQMI